MMAFPYILGFTYFLFIIAVNCQNEPPSFTADMNGLSIPETTAVGDVVYTLKGYDPENSQLTYGIEADMFEVREPTRGKVYLTRKLDYETMSNPILRIKVWLSDGQQKVDKEVTVTVRDVNDEIPKFNLQTYEASIPEGISVGDVVLRDIKITDADRLTSARTLQVSCDPQPANPDVCEIFGFTVLERSSQLWQAHLVTLKDIDYEQHTNFHLIISATDGTHTARKSITVTVEDLNDTPPKFTSALSAIINETTIRGKDVLTVTAEDGDKGIDRKIAFKIVTNPFDLFRIDTYSGLITTNKAVDREDPKLSEGFVTLEVKAMEILESGRFGEDALTSTVAAITITILDVNDNDPRFDRSLYPVQIPEDVVDGTPLPGVSIKVTDADQGINAEFELYLVNYKDIFSIQPTSGSKSLTASVFVKNSKAIDYEKPTGKSYVVQVIARETKTSLKRSGETYVMVEITDVNDNKPEFAKTSYTADVSETATAGTPVIRITATDRDSGYSGNAGLRYKVIGNGADKFSVDLLTGDVTVAPCHSPGSGNCLDREQQDKYELSFVAGDKHGEGFVVSVPLTIRILDENDNPPRLALSNYVSYIDEGLTIPDPNVQVQATDADSIRNNNNRITYSIVGGNVGDLWRIGSQSGVVTARQPVDYEATPGNQGFYLLTVQAADPKNKVTAQVKIFVRDTNDHKPVFTQNGFYEQYISEETPPGTVVETVTATDADSDTGLNGQVEYRITTGAQDKFVISQPSGVIKVAPDGAFDYDVQNKYEMIVIAADKGQPRKSATAKVVVHIRDANNKNPYFVPSTVRVEIYENSSIGHSVIQMQAEDPDLDANLVYYMEEPKQAWNPQGEEVKPTDYDFRNMFNIERTTGVVRVSRSLEHDRVSIMSSTIKAVDTSGSAGQSATATLIINILEVNSQPPIFGPPWLPSRPELDYNIQEELPIDSYVTTIVASDPTDAISEYEIISNPGGYFKIAPNTGVVTIAKPLDYEKLQTAAFIVTAADNGKPKLTSTATINIHIQNINDENPTFKQPLYQTSILENSPARTSVVTVKATDLDLGDFGLVRYSLTDARFQIDSITGLMTVADGAVLDRETTPLITVTVTARDSPNHPGDSRFALVHVYITLLDDNDHTPHFGEDIYRAVVEESADAGTPVIRLTAGDGDIGENAELVYRIVDGDPQNMFTVNQTTGHLSVWGSLDGQAGQHNLTVEVRDRGSPSLHSTAFIILTVLEGNNNHPVWDFPSTNNSVVSVIENQYLGMKVTKVIAHDEDEGDNGLVTYGFYHETKFVYQTPEFNINPYTGVITARRLFDYEEKNSYLLQLVARDSGPRPLESTRYLTVRVVDADDHDPEFNQYKNCCAIPYHISVYENTSVGTNLTRVKATDKDFGENARITYHIHSGNNDAKFRLDADTGVLSLARKLQYDKQSLHVLTIGASDQSSDQRTRPHCKCASASVVNVFIHVIDINESPPVFAHQLHNACVALTAPVGKLVTVMEAKDKHEIFYNISQLHLYDRSEDEIESMQLDTFSIGAENGSVYTNALMTHYKDDYFNATVTATNTGGQMSATALRVWVTSSSDEITITFRKPPNEVNRDLPDIIRKISEMTNGGIVCVSDPRYHVTEQYIVKADWTDLVIHVIDKNTLKLIDGEELIRILKKDQATLDALYIERIVAGSSLWDGFIIDPVLAAIIAIAILLLILLLLLCLFCCCCAAIYEKHYAYKYPVIGHSSRINPLYYMDSKPYIDQELSMNVGMEMENLAFEADDQLDGGMGAQLNKGGARLVIPGGDQTVTETTTMTTRQYQMSQEGAMIGDSQQTQGAGGGGGGGAISSDEVRIVAGLEAPPGAGGAGGGGGGYSGGGGQTGIYVDRTQGGSYEATFGSLRHAPKPPKAMSLIGTTTRDGDGTGGFTNAAGSSLSGPSPFGAILTRSEGNLAQRLRSSNTDLFTYQDIPSYQHPLSASQPRLVPTYVPAPPLSHHASRVYSTSSGTPNRMYSNATYMSQDGFPISPQTSYEPVFLSDGFPTDVRVQQHIRENRYTTGGGYMSS